MAETHIPKQGQDLYVTQFYGRRFSIYRVKVEQEKILRTGLNPWAGENIGQMPLRKRVHKIIFLKLILEICMCHDSAEEGILSTVTRKSTTISCKQD